MPVTTKVLEWIEGTAARWNGYPDFQRNPHPKLEFLAQHMD
jgi:hypothetical protein